MTTLTLPKIKFGKTKERSQMCIIATDDGRLIDKELPALYSCMADDATAQAWLIDPENQYQGKDGHWYQAITEKTRVPLALRQASQYTGEEGEKILDNLADEIYKLTKERAKARQVERAHEQERLGKITMIISIVCGTLLIIGAFNYFGG